LGSEAGLGGLRRLRFARKAAASFSGEDLAIKALSPVPKIPIRKPEFAAFLRGILTL
jgi:hypothetical protein